MPAPKRIQRKRTAGWRMPEGAVYVGRPTKWGNPFRVLPYADAYAAGIGDASVVMGTFYNGRKNVRAHEDAVRYYREWITSGHRRWLYGCRPHGPLSPTIEGPVRGGALVSPCDWYALYQAPFGAEDIRRELRGRDLACWCPLDQPCHADVLLKLANGDAT